MATSYTDDEEIPGTPATRKGEGVMSVDDIQAAIGPIITDAIGYADAVLSPEREKATDYYLGRPFGNEEEGRSQVVLTEVRDTISGIIPDLQKIFFGPERVVEFLPKTAETATEAKLRSDYVHFNFVERNSGFLETNAVLKDGLIRKIGVFKSWWEDSEVRAYTLRKVTDEELDGIAADETVKLLGAKKDKKGTNTVHITRALPGRVRVKALKPEEFIYNRTASDTESGFIMLGHRTRMKRGDLLAMGISKKVLDDYGNDDNALATNPEEIARMADGQTQEGEQASGKANELIAYGEYYFQLDVDGDGYAELRQICTIGTAHYPVKYDAVDAHPFALFIPDPEPHTLHGGSWFDRTHDLQLTKSSVLRAQLDSLAAAIFSRYAYVEGQANVNDILNTEIGAPIRMRSQNAVQAFNIPFSGEAATPILQYLDEVVERRTGRKRGAEGLDMDGLQSTTDQGVNAALAGAQAQTEMLARIFAEMTLKPLFRRMYRLLKDNQQEETLKLRSQVVTLDPSKWEDDLDVSVNVALGTTMVEKKLATLGAIVAKQEQVLQLMGPMNPIVDIPMYAATLQRGVELGGFKDVESFFKSVAPNWQEQQPQAPPEPSPEMALVEIEKAKAQAQAQLDAAKEQRAQATEAAKMDLEERKLQQAYILAQQEMQLKLQLESAKLEAETGVKIEQAQIQAELDLAQERARLEAESMRESMRVQTEDARSRDEMALTHERETAALHLEHERAREESAHKAAQSERDSARKHEESKSKAKENATPAAPALPAEIVIKRGKVKVNRDAQGKMTGLEDDNE